MSRQGKLKIGVKFSTGSGYTYTLIETFITDGCKYFKYKWHECPDPTFYFITRNDLDSVGMTLLICEFNVMRGSANELT